MLKDIVKIDNLKKIYELEVAKNVRNKKNLMNFELHKMEYLKMMEDSLLSENFKPRGYYLFVIKEPKVRLIMSQPVYDKTINHFVTRYILEPKLSKYLNTCNCATRKNMGTNYAIRLLKNNLEKSKTHEHIYALKLDIEKYFYNIDHEVLKRLIINDLEADEYKIICKIIDSTDEDYINNFIDNVNEKKGYGIPHYEKGKGLSIGNLSSQFLAIFYLHKLQHFIIHDLHLKYMVNYMDDYIFLHHDKEYLKKCLIIIEEKLNKEYKLKINKNKTYIRNMQYGLIFLGYNFKVVNKKTIIKISAETKKRLKHNLKLLKKNNKLSTMTFQEYFSSFMNYKYSYIYTNYYHMELIINNIMGDIY